MYVAVKGGEAAIAAAHQLLAPSAAATRGCRRSPPTRSASSSRSPSTASWRGLALRPRARRAGHQAGARRPDRGDLPAARLPHHAAALRLRRAGRHRRDAHRAAHLGDVQGPARRAGARPDLRLHPPPARSRARRRRATCRRRSGATADAEPMPRVTDLLGRRGPDRAGREPPTATPVGDLTREPLDFPADRDLRLQALARGDEGFLLALGYSTQRGYGRTHPFVGEIRIGEVEVEIDVRRSSASPCRSARITRHRMPDGQPVQGHRPRRRRSSPAATGWSSASASARRWRWRWSTGRCAPRELGEERDRAGAGRGVRDLALPTTSRRPASSST